MEHARRLAKMIRLMVDEVVRNNTFKFSIGEYVGAESVDANLSNITIDGRTHRFVQKLKSVTGLTAGDLVLVLYGPGMPLTIVGVPQGDISLAT